MTTIKYNGSGDMLLTQDDIHALMDRITELTATDARKNDAMGSMVREIGELRVELACAQQAYFDTQKRLDDAERARDLEREERDALQARIDAMLAKVGEARQDLHDWGSADYTHLDQADTWLDAIANAGQEEK